MYTVTPKTVTGLLLFYAGTGSDLAGAVALSLDEGDVRLGLLDRFEPPVDLLLAGDPVEQEAVGEPAGAEACEHDESQDGGVNSEHRASRVPGRPHSARFSIPSSAVASRCSSPK